MIKTHAYLKRGIMKKLILILFVLVVLSVGVVTVALAANAPTVSQVHDAVQSTDGVSTSSVVNVSDSDSSVSTFSSGHHGMCDGGESAAKSTDAPGY